MNAVIVVSNFLPRNWNWIFEKFLPFGKLWFKEFKVEKCDKTDIPLDMIDNVMKLYIKKKKGKLHVHHSSGI